MSWVGEALLTLHNWRNNVAQIKCNIQKEPKPLRIGVISAAAINGLALFDAVDTHPGVVASAVASRSVEKAQAQIAKYGLQSTRASGSYAELLEDPEIDAVYIPLPTAFHYEWAIKAMEARKHVLIEKPVASNAEQVERIKKCSASTGMVAVEALHWRFHPAAHSIKATIASGQYGNVQSVSARMILPRGLLKQDDIRLNYSLAGGACMDLTYVFSATKYFAGPTTKDFKYKVLEATARPTGNDPRVDEAIRAVYSIEYPDRPAVVCTVEADLSQPKLFGLIPKFWHSTPVVVVELERARIEFSNFVLPWVSHQITTTEKDANGGLTTTRKIEQHYSGGPEWGSKGQNWWTTYRYQLEAFVAKIKSASMEKESETPWISLGDSVQLMELIDAVYDKAGLPRRGL
ncbi:uncharacterized protein Z518_00118 [Rhinocladiella mackenziei CBS 650.93]|uniref:D-xylose 1-dehydrogenase (NADP(+), D-xylono-1,5-lactone-forming) n=1 Tax=Rhinocladiella mackenziei CBS 650.93 TaxID=1442369 RepID=A0A0D2JI63_9EURO|nr:uncharacterized protein Z518_00118 [Rhinocladiella mackenziei CBS 650.93]KIX09040.1 hypothetical protein Z518_00118 [Rhinocladiella mackenziei CBS 650.93]